MEIFGRSPIPLPILILGKVAMFFSWAFFLLKMIGLDSMLYDSEVTRAAGFVFALAGLVIAGVGLVNLGDSARVGFPTTKFELKTHGIYRFTRNPAYLGGFMVCIGSCLYYIHTVNLLLFATTFVIHHSIVIQEEKFLEETFGKRWLEYNSRVPRYIGRKKSLWTRR